VACAGHHLSRRIESASAKTRRRTPSRATTDDGGLPDTLHLNCSNPCGAVQGRSARARHSRWASRTTWSTAILSPDGPRLRILAIVKGEYADCCAADAISSGLRAAWYEKTASLHRIPADKIRRLGDGRTYDYVVACARADPAFKTATGPNCRKPARQGHQPHHPQVRGINASSTDNSGKPPATRREGVRREEIAKRPTAADRPEAPCKETVRERS